MSLINRVSSLPTVATSFEVASDYYNQAKEKSVYFKSATSYAETATASINGVVAPYLENERVKSIDAYLVSYFNAVVERFPIINSSFDDMKSFVDSYKKAMEAKYVDSVQFANAKRDMLVDQMKMILETIITKKDNVVSSVNTTVTSSVDFATTKKDQLVEQTKESYSVVTETVAPVVADFKERAAPMVASIQEQTSPIMAFTQKKYAEFTAQPAPVSV
eukprot:CFRG7405T1